MLIKKSPDLRYSDVTPQSMYLNRRKFLAGVPAAFLAGNELLSPSRRALAATTKLQTVKSPLSTTGEKINSEEDVTGYNNYYEFGTGKDEPQVRARNFKTYPWTVSIEGECAKPRKITIDEIMKAAPLEERIYRHRCVEAWSIVVPWIGYSLSTLIKEAEPTAKAKYVAFQSLWDQKQMPKGRYAGIDLPYVEGLRMDEAMHPLALLAFGLYGETLPNQNGAPVRIVVPWKYGYKSIKSIVKIKFQEHEPPTTWNLLAPNEYGFYSNVNPGVDHPRWSQSTEHRLGEIFPRKTLMFNGYNDLVASMYNGMDLKKFH